MRIPSIFIPEKNLNDKIEDILKKISKNGQSDNTKYDFRFELKAVKNNKDFLITYSVPKTYPESDIVQLKIEYIQSGKEDFDEFIELATNLCSYHQYSIILLGQQKKEEKTLDVCTAYSKHKTPYENLVSSIISFYTGNTDEFEILDAVINNKSYKNEEVLLNYAP